MLRVLLAVSLLALGACSDGATDPEQGGELGPAQSNAPSAKAGEAAEPAKHGEAQMVKEGNELFQFAYGWPAEADAVAAVRTTLADERRRFRNELTSSAEAAKQEAASSGFPYRQHSFMKEWDVVAQTPRFLSLSARIYTYEGGAHGMTTFDALVWDKERERVVQPQSIFVSAQALDDALRPAFCDALDAQRTEKRQEPVQRGADPFSECIDPSSNGSLILGSTNGEAIDRLGVLVPPYNAGPYAEGAYDITLLVTAEVIAALKPEYRGGFAIAP